MNLLPSQEQSALVEAAISFLQGEVPTERLRPQNGRIGNPDGPLFPKLGELGFLGLGVAEEAGGLGLGPVEEALMFREYGRHLVSLGLLGVTLGARLAAGDAALGGGIIAGTTGVGLICRRPNGGLYLIEAKGAEYAVLFEETGTSLYRTADLSGVQDVVGMDSDLLLQRAEVGAAQPVVREEGPYLYQLAILLISAYAVGVAQVALALGVEYAKVREQFGKPIGSFQAIKHKCADMAISAEIASCQVDFASVTLAERREDASFQVRAANLVALDAALKNGATTIQVHGAIGFTSEIEAHICVKRAHTLDFLSGTLRRQRNAMLKETVA